MTFKKNIKYNNKYKDFDWKKYLEINTDLPRNFSEIDCKSHFLNNGIYEKRIYKLDNIPSDFNWMQYLSINSDLPRNFTENECKIHFLRFGIYEKRFYKIEKIENSTNLLNQVRDENKICKLDYSIIPSGFDWKVYLEINTDLPRNYTKIDCLNHFINYGKNEGRILKKTTFSSIFYANTIFMEVDIFNIILEHIKYSQLLPFSLNDIMTNHNKINNIIAKYSNSYKNSYKNSYSNKLNDSIKQEDVSNMSLIINKTNKPLFLFLRTIEYDDFINFTDIYNSFIFILDLPNSYTGGTKEFINNINLKYSEHNKLLFLRPNNKKLYDIYFENMKIVDLNDSLVINLINLNKFKIDKVFFNHLINFSENIINFIFSLEHIKKTIITHDHFFITNDLPQNSIDSIYNYLFHDNVDSLGYRKYDYFLNSLDTIVSQNINNIYMINDKYHEKLIISELPDFNLPDNKIISNNQTINVLLIGDIHKFKGAEFVHFLIKDYYKNTNIKVCVFGSLSCYQGDNLHKYKNIHEFNSLLTNYKPNLIIETSVWPETYSYTLTLSMTTQLPILILKKPFHSVVEERVKNYNNAFFYSSLKELDHLINNKKQDFFYTIKPVIYFNNFWDNYFNYQYNEIKVISNQFKDYQILNLMYQKNVVFITSKIDVSENSFSYVSWRNVYTNAQRFEQTINTIASVRKNIPDAFIILFDNSKFNTEDYNNLKSNVDYFINPCHDDSGFLNYYTNNCQFKCLAELSQIIYAYYYFFKHVNFTKINHFFKISGRYYVNENFDYNNFDNDKIIFKQNNMIINRNYLYTSFYKLTKEFLPEFFSKVINIFSNKHEYFSYDLEVIFYEIFHKQATLIDMLGVTQNFACWKFTDMI